MGKVIAFFSKWAFAIVLCIVDVALLFALGCCVYTAITNPFVGIVGGISVLLSIAVVTGLFCVEVRELRY